MDSRLNYKHSQYHTNTPDFYQLEDLRYKNRVNLIGYSSDVVCKGSKMKCINFIENNRDLPVNGKRFLIWKGENSKFYLTLGIN